jgi:hypothetical protein
VRDSVLKMFCSASNQHIFIFNVRNLKWRRPFVNHAEKASGTTGPYWYWNFLWARRLTISSDRNFSVWSPHGRGALRFPHRVQILGFLMGEPGEAPYNFPCSVRISRGRGVLRFPHRVQILGFLMGEATNDFLRYIFLSADFSWTSHGRGA